MLVMARVRETDIRERVVTLRLVAWQPPEQRRIVPSPRPDPRAPSPIGTVVTPVATCRSGDRPFAAKDWVDERRGNGVGGLHPRFPESVVTTSRGSTMPVVMISLVQTNNSLGGDPARAGDHDAL